MYSIRSTIHHKGVLTLTNLPFSDGEEVTVIIEGNKKEKNTPKISPSEYQKMMKSLRGSARGIDTTIERDEDRV
jgi:predicted DNA-binding antitoxin AbrB/MazE fold protein